MSKKIREKILPIIFALSVISGLLLLFYPIISDVVNSKSQTKVISQYNEEVKSLSKENYDEEFEKAYAFNDMIYHMEDALYHPEKIEGYEDILNVTKNGIMGYVSIPKIDVKLGIYHGTNDTVLRGAVGHLKGSSLPVGGENTHAVIAAHRGMASASLFTDIDKLEIGDEFTITVLDKVLIYQVDQILTVLPEEDEPLRIIKGEDHVTLQTCTPYGVNSHRLLVRGVRTGTTTLENDDYNQDPSIITPLKNKRNLIPLIIAAIILVLGFIARQIVAHIRKGRSVNSTQKTENIEDENSSDQDTG